MTESRPRYPSPVVLGAYVALETRRIGIVEPVVAFLNARHVVAVEIGRSGVVVKTLAGWYPVPYPEHEILDALRQAQREAA